MEQHTASRRAVLSAASLAAGGILVAGIGAPALGSGSKAGDVEILNFALQLEEMKAALYTQALLHANLTGDLAQYARVVGRQEREHVAFLRRTLGSAAQAGAGVRLRRRRHRRRTGSARPRGCSRISPWPRSTARRPA